MKKLKPMMNLEGLIPQIRLPIEDESRDLPEEFGHCIEHLIKILGGCHKMPKFDIIDRMEQEFDFKDGYWDAAVYYTVGVILEFGYDQLH